MVVSCSHDRDGGTALLIDLKKNARLWEDLCDAACAKSRAAEPLDSPESVKLRPGPRANDGLNAAGDPWVGDNRRGHRMQLKADNARHTPSSARPRIKNDLNLAHFLALDPAAGEGRRAFEKRRLRPGTPRDHDEVGTGEAGEAAPGEPIAAGQENSIVVRHHDWYP